VSGPRRAALILALLVTAVSGCGYSLRGHLPGHIRTIAVPIFVNRTQEPAVESIITRAVVEAFSTNGRLRLAKVEDADAILEGEITGFAVDSIAFDRNANVQLYRLRVTMNLTMRDLRQNTVLFRQPNFSERSDFRVQGAVSQTIAREETALRQAAVDIARSVVSLAIDRF
jgi:outer membrane lipopolysaccharide assembly protein LptE/RlpB